MVFSTRAVLDGRDMILKILLEESFVIEDVLIRRVVEDVKSLGVPLGPYESYFSLCVTGLVKHALNTGKIRYNPYPKLKLHEEGRHFAEEASVFIEKRKLFPSEEWYAGPFHREEWCWNPRMHISEWSIHDTGVLKQWLEFQRKNDSPYMNTIPEVVRVAPLCEFGGFTNRPDNDMEQAVGIYAICPDCRAAYKCEYHFTGGMLPKNCEFCKTVFSRRNYFQPVAKYFAGPNLYE